MDYPALGQRLRARRRLKGMTQEALAEVAGISTSFLGHVERGTRIPSIETLVALALALDVRVDSLLADSLPYSSSKVQLLLTGLEQVLLENEHLL